MFYVRQVESGDVANLKTNLIIEKLLLEMRTSNGDQSDCEKHMGEPMRLFCETCDQPICQGCAITDHREHKYKSIKRLFLVEKEKVLKAMEEAKLNINCVKSAIQSTEEKEKAVKENSAQLYQDIDSFIAKRVEILQRLRLRMEKDVDDLTQAELKRLGEEKKAFSLPLSRIEKSLEKADQALCRENEVDVLSLKSGIFQQLDDLKSSVAEFKPYDTPIFRLEVNSFLDDETAGEMARITKRAFECQTCSLSHHDDEYYFLSMQGGQHGVLYNTCDHQRVHFILDGATHLFSSETKVRVKIICLASGTGDFPAIGNNQDGTYSFSYCPETTGTYKIEVLVNGSHINGSPFSWEVEGRPQLSSDILNNALSGPNFRDGQHSWKIQCLFPVVPNAKLFIDSHINIQIGVTCWGVGYFILSCSQYSSICKKQPKVSSESSIKSLRLGDVLTFYLDFGSSHLLVFNERSNELERFQGVRSDVMPYIHPRCSQYFRIPISSKNA